ncbi:MAG: NAD(P)-dependent oxidoreductase [Melioribacteraceae bacterium]
MKVLVTGATGFTGKALATKLNSLGRDVRVIVRNSKKVDFANNSDYDIFEGSIVDEEAVEKAVKGVDVIFHIAATFREPGITDQIYHDVHVKATLNLLKAAKKFGVKKFVHCSTGGVHGHIEHPPANEEYRYSPGDIYQITKLEGELKALEFYKETGLPVSVVRPTPIYGPGDMRLLKLYKMAKQPVTILLGNGKMFYHLVYIDDLVDGFILASEKDKAVGESFLIGGPDIPNLNEIMDTISDIAGFSKTKIHLPAYPVQIAGTICEKICIPLGIDPPLYRRRVDFFTKSRSFDISKAKNLLDYQPKISSSEGLKKTAEWYKMKGHLSY